MRGTVAWPLSALAECVEVSASADVTELSGSSSAGQCTLCCCQDPHALGCFTPGSFLLWMKMVIVIVVFPRVEAVPTFNQIYCALCAFLVLHCPSCGVDPGQMGPHGEDTPPAVCSPSLSFLRSQLFLLSHHTRQQLSCDCAVARIPQDLRACTRCPVLGVHRARDISWGSLG